MVQKLAIQLDASSMVVYPQIFPLCMLHRQHRRCCCTARRCRWACCVRSRRARQPHNRSTLIQGSEDRLSYGWFDFIRPFALDTSSNRLPWTQQMASACDSQQPCIDNYLACACMPHSLTEDHTSSMLIIMPQAYTTYETCSTLGQPGTDCQGPLLRSVQHEVICFATILRLAKLSCFVKQHVSRSTSQLPHSEPLLHTCCAPCSSKAAPRRAT